MIDPDNLPEQPEALNKVLPTGEPLIATVWICPRCNHQRRGGPPDACTAGTETIGCPVGKHPALRAMRPLDNEGREIE